MLTFYGRNQILLESTLKYQENIITVQKGAGGLTLTGTRLGMAHGCSPLLTQPLGKVRCCLDQLSTTEAPSSHCPLWPQLWNLHLRNPNENSTFWLFTLLIEPTSSYLATKVTSSYLATKVWNFGKHFPGVVQKLWVKTGRVTKPNLPQSPCWWSQPRQEALVPCCSPLLQPAGQGRQQSPSLCRGLGNQDAARPFFCPFSNFADITPGECIFILKKSQ